MKKQLKTDLDAIVDQVRTELEPILKAEFTKAEKKLAKAAPGEDTSPEVPADKSATKDDSASDDSAPPAPKADASASPPADGPPPPAADGPPGDASASPPGDASGDPSQDMSSDPAELQQAYASLPLEELQMHYLAVKAALMQAMGNPDGSAPPADPAADPSATAMPPAAPPASASPSPAAPPPPPPAPPAPDAPPPALKAEAGMTEHEEANGENPLDKSEKDLAIEALQKTVAEQGAVLQAAQATIKKLVETPVRKSITTVADIKKTEGSVDVKTLSRDDIKARLKRAAEKQTLTKSDRERINLFALGHLKVEGIADLIS